MSITYSEEEEGYGHTYLILTFEGSFETITTRKYALFGTLQLRICLLADQQATITMNTEKREFSINGQHVFFVGFIQHVDVDSLETYVAPIVAKWEHRKPSIFELCKDCDEASSARMMEHFAKQSFLKHREGI